MYADDLVCSQYGMNCDIAFNDKKSNVMIVRCKEDKKFIFPVFYLCNTPLETCKEIKLLSGILTDDISDDKGMNPQCHKLYAQANMLLCPVS